MTEHRRGPLLRHVDLGIEIHAEGDEACGLYQIVEVGIADPTKRHDIDVAEDLHEAGLVARGHIEELMQ